MSLSFMAGHIGRLEATDLGRGPRRLGATGKICDTVLSYVLCSFVTQIMTKNDFYVVFNCIFYHKKVLFIFFLMPFILIKKRGYNYIIF
jgi:hypothetical protein